MSEFVTYDIAKRLKEIGFNCLEPFAMYQLDDNNIYKLYTSDPYYYDINDFDENSFVAPTLHQAISWLRNNMNIMITVNPLVVFNKNINDDKFKFDIFIDGLRMELPTSKNIRRTYPKWEECELYAIEYVINNIINKN